MNDESRLVTGIAGLDVILQGGFFRGGIYMVQGCPGSGKTILAHHICFAEIAAGRRALYITLLAESHARLIANLSVLSFYDPSKIPQSLYYVSAFAALEQEGLRGLLDVVRREMRSHQASVLVVDGLVPAEQAAKSNIEIKKFVRELQTLSEMANCTTFLLSSNAGGSKIGAERTMVEGLLELSNEQFGSLRERRLEVIKLRGGGYLRGQHSFDMTDDGLVAYPRIEAMLKRPSTPDEIPDGRVSSGCAGLDEILHGGFPRSSTTMLLGPSGAGKTSLGLQFLSASSKDEPGVHLSFYETRERAARKATSMGIPLARLQADQIVKFLWTPTTEGILDDVAGQLVDLVRRHKAKRIFIDGLDGFAQLATDPKRLVRVFTALSNEFRTLGATTLYAAETDIIVAGHVEAPPTGVSTMLENLILLRYVEISSSLRRLISVLKVRDSDFDPAVREVQLTGAGLVIKGPFVGWDNLVSGAARRSGDAHK